MNIVIGDDHGLIRTGIKLICKDLEFISIIGEGQNGEEIIKIIDSLEKQKINIDLIILDINMPNMNGFNCIEKLRQKNQSYKILFLTMYEEDEYILKALTLGAVGYVSKGYADKELPEALKIIQMGGTYISPRLSHHIIKNKIENSILSPRENQILTYISQGYNLTEIGKELNLSVKTIDTYKSRIMTKLNCKRKHELIAIAIERKLV